MVMRLRNALIGGRPTGNATGELALTALRLFAGLSIALAHGWGKMPPSERFIEGVGRMGFPVPELFAFAAGGAEFFGGLFLAAGLLTRPSASAIMITMLVAGFIRHADDPFSSMEKALLFAAVMGVFVALGGGRYSADRLLRKVFGGSDVM